MWMLERSTDGAFARKMIDFVRLDVGKQSMHYAFLREVRFPQLDLLANAKFIEPPKINPSSTRSSDDPKAFGKKLAGQIRSVLS
jgi:hypothetical protein